MKLFLLVLTTLVSFAAFSDEAPNNSYPLTPYARCEKKSDKKDWSYSVWADRVEVDGPTQVYNEKGELVDKEGSIGNVFMQVFVREYRCLLSPKGEFRWYPIRRNVESRVQLMCKQGGGLFGSLLGGGRYAEDFHPIPYGPVPMPQRSLAPEYNDYWGQVDFIVPLEKCMSGDQKKAYANGETVEIKFNTRYAPFGRTGNRGDFYWSHLVVVKVKAKH